MIAEHGHWGVGGFSFITLMLNSSRCTMGRPIGPSIVRSIIVGCGGGTFLLSFLALTIFPGVELFSSDGASAAELGRELRKAVRAKDYRVATKLVTQLAEDGSLPAYRAMLSHAIIETAPELEVQVREKLTAALEKDPSKLKAFVLNQCLEARSHRARIFSLEMVGGWPVEPANLKVLHAAVGDRRTAVSFTAVRLIRKLKREESVAPLIDHLLRIEKTGRRSRLHFDIVDFLKAMTETELESGPDWKNWNKNRGKKRLKKKATKKRRGGRRTAVKSDFFSIPVNSDRVLFIIDVSESMLRRDPDEPPKTSKKTVVVDKNGADKPPKPPPASRERLTRVKKELMSVIRALPEETRFGVVSFHHEIKRWGGKTSLQKAIKETKVEAIRWVAALRAEGATRTDSALENGLNLSGVDTIFLLTDGRPKNKSNQNLSVDAILERTQHVNRFRCCRINTVSFAHVGDPAMRRFVTALAAQSDGRTHALP